MTPVKITDDLFVPINHRLTSENPPHPSVYISLSSQLQTTLLPFASRFCFIFSFFGENLWSTIRGELFESVFHFFPHIFKNNWKNWQLEVCKLFLMVEKSTLQSVTSLRAHGYHPVLFPPLTLLIAATFSCCLFLCLSDFCFEQLKSVYVVMWSDDLLLHSTFTRLCSRCCLKIAFFLSLFYCCSHLPHLHFMCLFPHFHIPQTKIRSIT